MVKSSTLYVITFFSIVSFLVFLGGLVWGVHNVTSGRSSLVPTLPIQSGKVDGGWNMVALGDSITRGIGDTEGTGYVGYLRQALLSSGKQDVTLTNLAVSGATSADLMLQMSEKSVQGAMARSNLIVMTIGSNDLFQGAEDLQNINVESVEQSQKRYLDNLDQILDAIRNVNPHAPIYLLGLYNPFGNLEQSALTTKIVVDWNRQTQLSLLSRKQVTFVPVLDMFQGNLDALLYSDHFHPNHEGYRRIGMRLIQLIDPDRKG